MAWGGSFCWSGPALSCLWVVKMAQIHCAAAVDGQRPFGSLGQAGYSKSQVVARPSRGDLC